VLPALMIDVGKAPPVLSSVSVLLPVALMVMELLVPKSISPTESRAH